MNDFQYCGLPVVINEQRFDLPTEHRVTSRFPIRIVYFGKFCPILQKQFPTDNGFQIARNQTYSFNRREMARNVELDTNHGWRVLSLIYSHLTERK